MALLKIGTQLKILKTAASIEELVMDKPLAETSPVSKIIETKKSDHLYYRARAISSLETSGPNGNFDGFPKKELQAAVDTFLGKNIFLNHDSDNPIKSVGRIVDALFVDDAEAKESYIEIVGRIDRVLHPEIARMIETGELNATSMGCSCDESECSVCGTKLHSDADEKCEHLSPMGLGKEFTAELDKPEFNIMRGQKVKAYAINSGISFTEDSIVNVPADGKALIKTILSNMRQKLSKKAALSKEEQLDLTSQMAKLFEKLDDTTKNEVQAEFCGICPPVKESSMSDKNITPSDEQKKILSKLSALEMEQLESYVSHKTKKANEVANQEVIAEAAAKEESFLQKLVAKVKTALASEPVKEDFNKLPRTKYTTNPADTSEGRCARCGTAPGKHDSMCPTCSKEVQNLSAKFNEDKNNILASTWSLFDGNKLVLDASLKEIWGSQFELLSFEDQTWATSEAYGKEVLARYEKEGLAKLADLWDVTHKLSKTAEGNQCAVCDKFLKSKEEKQIGLCSQCEKEGPAKAASLKTAAEPKFGPSGTRATPTTGTSNKKHTYPTTPDFTDPKPGTSSKGPAAPAHQDMKTDPKFKMPGQEKGQTGPSAPKPMTVKTDYSEPKPEADGKEVKTTPKNPDEKKHDKSEKEVKTDYVAAGTEAMEAEADDKKSKKESAKKCLDPKCDRSKGEEGLCKSCLEKEKDKDMFKHHPDYKRSSKEQSSLIKWATLSPEAQDFIKKHVEKHMKEDGIERAQAVAAAYSEARKKGMDVPSKASSQETNMQKKATDKPVESVDGSTLPEGKKKFDAKPEESVQGTTLPEEGKTSFPETSAQGDKKHKTPDLTKKPTESVDGTTLPSDKKTSGDKDEQSSQGDTQPKGTKVNSEPDMAVNKSASPVACADCGAKIDSAKGEWCEKCMVKHLDKNAPVTAATEMPAPEGLDTAVTEDVTETAPAMDAPRGAEPKVDAPKAEVSAFDKTETVDVGEGYTATKDKESKEIIISKDGKEVKRLPDGFGAEMPVVLELLKSVLGLAAGTEAPKPEMGKPEAPKMDEAPKMEEAHPALEEAHEDEMGMKESALKAKEAELVKKEAALKAREEAEAKAEASKKFATLIQARSERCRKIVALMVDKEALSMDKEVYEAELRIGTYLLDAQKKAFEASITAKHKELLAMDDNALKATEKVINDLAAPTHVNQKRASYLKVSPAFGEQLSDEQELAKIFKTMGNPKQRPQ